MSWIGSFYRTAVGKKAVMAVTGVILFAWVFAHMLGNLKLFYGTPEHMNEYAHFLRTVGSPAVPEGGLLWIARLVMLALVLLHIWSAYALTVMNWKARPLGYHDRDYVAATYAARTMRWGGVIILLFVIYHLLHLTIGAPVAPATFIKDHPYENVVAGFRVWWVSAFYILANIALGSHLYHGAWSMFNSVGFNNPKFASWRRNFATAFALIISLGNISLPLAVLIGIVR